MSDPTIASISMYYHALSCVSAPLYSQMPVFTASARPRPRLQSACTAFCDGLKVMITHITAENEHFRPTRKGKVALKSMIASLLKRGLITRAAQQDPHSLQRSSPCCSSPERGPLPGSWPNSNLALHLMVLLVSPFQLPHR